MRGGGLYWSQATLSVQGCCSSLGGGRGVVLVSDYTLCAGVLLLPGLGEGVVLVSDYTLCAGVLLLPGWGEGGCIGLRLHSLCRGVDPPWVGGGGLYWSQTTLSVQGCCSSLGGGRGVVLVSDYTLCAGVLLLPGWGEGGCIGLRLGLYWSQTTLSVQGCCSSLGGGRGVVLVSDYTLCSGVLILPGWGEGGCIGLRLHSLCRGVAPPWVGGGGLYWSQTTLSDYTLCAGVLLLPGWGEGGCIGLRLHSLCRGVAPPWVGGGGLYWSQTTLSVQGCCSSLGGGRGLYWSQTTLSVQGCCFSLGGGRGVVLVSDYTLCAGVLILPGWGEGGCIGLRLHSLCRGVAPPWVGGGGLYWSQTTLSVQGCCSSLGGGRGVVLVSD